MSTVIRHSLETHVFVNENNEISIKQVCPLGNEDALVYFHPDHAKAICKAITKAAKDSKIPAGMEPPVE